MQIRMGLVGPKLGILTTALMVGALGAAPSQSRADGEGPLALRLRSRVEERATPGSFSAVEKAESWDPKQTAIIVCDMWDLHHCLNAVKRETEMAPTMDRVLKSARDKGAVIIHAPSECMATYKDHPARKRALETPKSKTLPQQIGTWCYKIPPEEKGVYPIDQTDGGEDDDPAEHKEWASKLAAMGRNPKLPWKSQTDLLTIDPARDYISDNGEEVWSILEARGVKNIVLMGVHLNMCVLGRPFGLRQMAKNGRHVVLMRDMTDTMYNPAMPPRVSHFGGTELMIEHVEKYVCPTITSDQFLGGTPFRFKDDTASAGTKP
jgi:nicotinamidase-related amidase